MPEQLASDVQSCKRNYDAEVDVQSEEEAHPPQKKSRADMSEVDAKVQFDVSLAGGSSYKVSVSILDTVLALREGIEKQHEVPPACRLKIFQDGVILVDTVEIKQLSTKDPVFAVVARETNLEVLFQAAGTYAGYKELLSAASPDPSDSNIKICGPMPSILSVLEDMAGQAPDIKHLVAGGKEGTMEFSGADGVLLSPSLDATPLLVAAGVDKFKSVKFVIELNSDSYNSGLGIVLEAPPLMDVTIDESGIPSYVYNGYGISADKKQNAIKFHPGMGGGQLRVEGVGGFHNSDMSFTPLSWTESGNKYHTFEITVGSDGRNEICVKGTKEGEVWRRSWTRQLTSGKGIPAVYAWDDLGGEYGKPLQLGQIHAHLHLDTAESRTVNLTVKGMSGSLLFGPEILPISTKVSTVLERVRTAHCIDAGCDLQLVLGAEELLADESLEKWALDETLTLTSVVAKRPPPVGNYRIHEIITDNMCEGSYAYSVHVTIDADEDGHGIVTWNESIGGCRFDFDDFSAKLSGTVTVADGGALTFDLKGQCRHSKYGGAVEVADKEVSCTGFVDDAGLHLNSAPVATPRADDNAKVLEATDALSLLFY